MQREFTWSNKPDEYYPPEILNIKSCTARIHRPVLTSEEYDERMREICDSAARLIESYERAGLEK